MTTAKSSEAQHGAVSVFIHWITAILLIAAIFLGFEAAGNEIEAEKVTLLRLHAIAGTCVLLMTVARILWWLFFDTKPDRHPGTSNWSNAIASIAHHLLDLLPLVGATFGALILAQSGAFEILFLDSSDPLPDFWETGLRLPHGIVARFILLLVVIHTIAATVRAFLKPKGFLKRMWF